MTKPKTRAVDKRTKWAVFVDLARMWPMLAVCIVTVVGVWFIAPQQTGILLYSVAKISMGGYMGYWVDRLCFPCSRPGEPPHGEHRAEDNTAAEYRRAAIVCAAMLALGLLS
jgi:hypothetical protein